MNIISYNLGLGDRHVLRRCYSISFILEYTNMNSLFVHRKSSQ